MAAACAVVAPAAGAGWSRPAQISAPTSIGILGPQIASSPTGAAAVSFNEVNVDAQADAGAFLALASKHGAFHRARAVPGVQEVLAIAFSGRTLDLLTASGPPGQPCCATAEIIRREPGSRFSRPQTLVTDVGGGATGGLVPLSNGRILAVIAGPQRLWVSDARGAGRFGPARGLTRAGSAPAALAVTGAPGGGSTVAWSEGSGATAFAASARPGATPSRPHTLLAVPPGHVIDGLQLAARAGGATLGWTESWNDAGAGIHGRAMAADVRGSGKLARPRPLSAPGDVASGLALSGDGIGDEVAAWDVCPPSGAACVVHTSVRRRLAPRFGPAESLGQIDPGGSPQVSMAGDGKALIGWITGGRVVLAVMRAGGARFGAPRPMSGGLADNLDLGFGPSGDAVATWSEGTFAAGVFAARLR